MAGRIASVCLWLALCGTCVGETWQTLENCRLKDSNWNDGDSFHVRHAGKEYIFRLCYIDTPEAKALKGLTKRTSAQAKYWNIRKADMFPLAHEATEFTRNALAGGFSVKTRWDDARGASELPRFFAVILTPQGDLAELLVARGYARIYGFSPDHPSGLDADKYKARLRKIESTARDNTLGAWAFSRRQPTAKNGPVRKPKPAAPPAHKPHPPAK